MGLVWGAANFAGPLIAGVVIAGPGDRTAYALLGAFTLVMALMLVRLGRREAEARAAAALVSADRR